MKKKGVYSKRTFFNKMMLYSSEEKKYSKKEPPEFSIDMQLADRFANGIRAHECKPPSLDGLKKGIQSFLLL